VCTALQGLSGLKVRVKLMSASHSLLAAEGERIDRWARPDTCA
jgi:hypothetical protein